MAEEQEISRQLPEKLISQPELNVSLIPPNRNPTKE